MEECLGELVSDLRLSFGVDGLEWGQELNAHGRVIICKGIVNAHILKVPSDMGVKETLNLFEVELRVDKDCPNVCFDHIREALQVFGQTFYTNCKQPEIPSEGSL